MSSVIFLGTPNFGSVVLQGLIDQGYDVKAVVTQPDKRVGRKQVVHQSAVKQTALKHNLPVYQPAKLSGSDELAELMKIEPDFIVTAAYGQFLPTKFLKSAKIAPVNVHGSLLPKYRGGAPIQYSVLNGDKETGITIMEMVKKMDAGDMIAKASTPITDDDNVGTMFEKLAVIGRDLLLKTLPDYIAGNIKPEPQDESKATFSPNITPEEERIDWNKSARDVFNHIRGLYPWPVAHTLLDGKRFKIYEATLAEGHGKPGEIIEKGKKSLVVATGDGAISLKTVQPAGKPRMNIVDFLNGVGRKLEVGDLIGE